MWHTVEIFIGMPHGLLFAQPLESLVDDCISSALQRFSYSSAPKVVISPYRFNPLGAHIDHQGGSVLARTLNQYTIICFWPSNTAFSTVHAQLAGQPWEVSRFQPGELQASNGWDAMARAAVTALAQFRNDTAGGSLESAQRGIDAVVFGTLVSGGLSSSASVILAYLSAIADVNGFSLSEQELVELSRRVENDYRGLNNGVQDQMSIAFGQRNHLAVLDVESVSARLVADPDSIEHVRFLMFYSGVSRDLGGSPFNARVAECQSAAAHLSPGARHLGMVPVSHRTEEAINRLPAVEARRSRHVYTEMARVQEGAAAWAAGDWPRFGQLMNESCASSIHDYESGSEWLIALHELARELPGVYGNRFSGGGYGGCLFMLARADAVDTIAQDLTQQYLSQYPDKESAVRVLVAESEGTVRIIQS